MDNKELYQQVIIDHARAPRHKYKLDNPTGYAAGKNPVCGDEIVVYVKEQDGLVTDIAFDGQGCAICLASASLMSEQLQGKLLLEVEKQIKQFQHMLIAPEAPEELDMLGKCEILEGVRHYPLRIKCATLAWHALSAALHTNKDDQTVSTE